MRTSIIICGEWRINLPRNNGGQSSQEGSLSEWAGQPKVAHRRGGVQRWRRFVVASRGSSPQHEEAGRCRFRRQTIAVWRSWSQRQMELVASPRRHVSGILESLASKADGGRSSSPRLKSPSLQAMVCVRLSCLREVFSSLLRPDSVKRSGCHHPSLSPSVKPATASEACHRRSSLLS